MSEQPPDCVVLAVRHHGLSEGIRGLLETAFRVVVMVVDEDSLVESVARLAPALVVVDLSLGRDGGMGWLVRLHARFPALPVIVLSVHDEAEVLRAAMRAGATGFVLKRAIAHELLSAVEAVLAGGHYPEVPTRPA